MKEPKTVFDTPLTLKTLFRMWIFSFFTAINLLIIGFGLESISPHTFRFYHFISHYPQEISLVMLLFLVLITFRMIWGTSE